MNFTKLAVCTYLYKEEYHTYAYYILYIKVLNTQYVNCK